MGFDDLFNSNHHQHNRYRDDRYNRSYGHSYDSRRSNHHYGEHLNFLSILQKIKANRKLKFLIILAGTLIIVIVFALIIILFPIIAKLFNYISQHGLQGVLDIITSFWDKIWKGTSN